MSRCVAQCLLNFDSREPSSCMIVGFNISYHSMKQCRILHENLDKYFAKAIGFIGCIGGAEKLLLAKVKNASGRIGILFNNHFTFLAIPVVDI